MKPTIICGAQDLSALPPHSAIERLYDRARAVQAAMEDEGDEVGR